MSKNVFDSFLESLPSEDTRRELSELAQKEPKLKDAFMAQSDYSRRLDQVREQLTELDGWKDWRERNWLGDEKMTKSEKVQRQRIEALEAEKQELETTLAEASFGREGEEVTFEQLAQQLDTYSKQKGYIDQTRFDEAIGKKTDEVNDLIMKSNRIVTAASAMVPYLNQKHQQEFGELFHPLEFMKQAHEAGQYDLEKFYDQWSAPRREQKNRSELETQLAAEKEKHAKELEEVRKEAETSRSMSRGSEGMPVDTDGGLTDMPEFQKNYLGLNKKDSDGVPQPPEGKLGDGSASAFYAREFARKPASV